jgi:hypothetical protein
MMPRIFCGRTGHCPSKSSRPTVVRLPAYGTDSRLTQLILIQGDLLVWIPIKKVIAWRNYLDERTDKNLVSIVGKGLWDIQLRTMQVLVKTRWLSHPETSLDAYSTTPGHTSSQA